MELPEYDFTLPPELIAQEPPSERGTSRMLLLDRATGAYRDSHFSALPDQLCAGDVLVLNDSRVIPARLFGHRVQPDGSTSESRVEMLLIEQRNDTDWLVLARPGRSLRVGARVVFAANSAALEAEVIAVGERGERTVRFACHGDFWQQLEALGHVPLPPYIRRADSAQDRERYQTVWAHERGSSAAPTAGLHFTPEMLELVRSQGVIVRHVTLHVGLGTFQPLSEESLRTGLLHEERYTLPAETAEEISRAKVDGRRVIAVGTTVVRTLEHCARWPAGESGRTRIFIRPGFEFRVVDAMLTNFHLPQSSLLMLVSAFAGRDHTLAAYGHAVQSGYRFFSYGDCMFIA